MIRAFASIVIAALVLCAASFCPAADESGIGGALLRNRFLESELSLAQKNKFYIVFDFEEGKVLLKARGSVFREWPIASCRQFGDELSVEALALEKRSYDSASLRVVIKPPEAEKDEEEKAREEKSKAEKAKAEKAKNKKAEAEEKKAQTAPKFDALELVDMPSEYTLEFQKNITVMVSPSDPKPPSGLAERLAEIKKSTLETYELYKLKKSAQGKTILLLKMDSNHAKALYWALGDNITVLFWASPK